MSTTVRQDVLTAGIRKEVVKARFLIGGMLVLLMVAGVGSLMASVSGAEVFMTTVVGVLAIVGAVVGMLYAALSGVFRRVS